MSTVYNVLKRHVLQLSMITFFYTIKHHGLVTGRLLTSGKQTSDIEWTNFLPRSKEEGRTKSAVSVSWTGGPFSCFLFLDLRNS